MKITTKKTIFSLAVVFILCTLIISVKGAHRGSPGTQNQGCDTNTVQFCCGLDPCDDFLPSTSSCPIISTVAQLPNGAGALCGLNRCKKYQGEYTCEVYWVDSQGRTIATRRCSDNGAVSYLSCV